MRLLVTRPEPDGARTAEALRARGCEVMLAPLLRMEAINIDLDGAWDALALTSANAVRAIAGHPRLKSLLAIPVYAVGGHTAEAARTAGFDKIVSADGDAMDLLRLIKRHQNAGARVLYLAGADRSADLADTGLAVSTMVVYRAAAVAAFPADIHAALAAGRLDGVLHFSRRSAGIYLNCAAAAGILDRALKPSHYCLSRQVAEPLLTAGAVDVLVAQWPREAELIDLVLA